MSVSSASAVDKGIMPGAIDAIAQLTLGSSTSDELEPFDALSTGESDPDGFNTQEDGMLHEVTAQCGGTSDFERVRSRNTALGACA